jgi:hypothetical protein
MQHLTEEETARVNRIRKQRNYVVGGLLVAFVVLVFFISIAKMS